MDPQQQPQLPQQQQPQIRQDQQEAIDQSHLRLLSIFHYIYGGLVLLGLVFLVFHYFLMRFILLNAAETEAKQAEIAQIEQMFGFLMVFYIIMGVFCIVLGTGNILCGRFLKKRIAKVFVFAVAGLNCLNIPLGTVLGVFTFIVLFRPSVAATFDTRKGG